MEPGENVPTVALVRPIKLLWLPIWLALAGLVVVYGWPHILWNFRYRGDDDHRVYLSCLYLGRYTQRIAPADGKCPYVLFIKGRADG